MRSDILELLREAAGAYVSGEDIAKRMQVSRTAIWKHIRELKQAGYAIGSHSRRGYALLEAPDVLLPNEIRHGLQTERFGREIYHYQEVTSTNNEAKRLASVEGVAEGAIIVSETQSGGRGRLSRGWFSPIGKGIWFSIVLRPAFLPQEAPKCTLLAAVAIARAIEKVTGVRAGIKWPNDILYQGKKLVGILTEMNAEMDGINYIVIGMGINVNITASEVPEELREIVTSLLMIRGEKTSRITLLCAILKELEIIYQSVLNQGFADILNEWKTYSVTLEQQVRVIGIDASFDGTAIDIDKDGALLVKTQDGVQRVLAGDVSIRPK